MPSDPAAAQDDLERERAIVEEAVAAVAGGRTGAADHPVERRRVRAVVDAVRDAR